MVHDPETDQLLLYGGAFDDPEPARTLWAFDGSGWSPVPVAGLRPTVERPSAFLAGHGGFYLVGPSADRPADPREVWFFDGDAWSAVAAPPGPLDFDPPVFDPGRDVLLACESGTDCATVHVLAENGTWSTFEDAYAEPPDARVHNLYFDPLAGAVFQELAGDDPGLFRWDAGSWTKIGRLTRSVGFRASFWVDEARRMRRGILPFQFEPSVVDAPLERDRRPALRATFSVPLPDPSLVGVPVAWSLDVRAGGEAPEGGDGFAVRFWDAVRGRWVEVGARAARPDALDTVAGPISVQPPPGRDRVDVSIESVGVGPSLGRPARVVVDRVSVTRRWVLPNPEP